jgi:mono/diheme cytochrome c family protein
MKNKTTPLLILGALACTSALALSGEVTENWTKYCTECHGEDGSGTDKGRSLKVKNYTKKMNVKDDAAIKSIENGMSRDRMPGYKDKLTGEEIKALVDHMRTFQKKAGN